MLIYLQMIETPEERSRFEQIYMTYKSLMFHVARKILHNDHDAEDAVHDAFVYLAKNISKISDPDCPKTKAYIVTIIESRAIDIYRSKARTSTVPLSEEIEGVSIDYDGTDELSRCMSKLPARYREFLLLKYSYGYTNRELAKFFGLSMDAIYKLDQRAKEKLKRLCLEDEVL